MAWPDQIRSSCARPLAGCRRKVHGADLELVDQAAGQVTQRLQQRKAVHLQPQRTVHLLRAGASGAHRFDATQRRGHEVGTQHVLQRPAGLDVLRAARGQLLDAPGHRPGLVAHDSQEALARRGVEVGVVEHFHRRLQVAQRCAAAFGQALQQLVLRGVALVVARDVVQHQHEAAQGRVGSLAVAHRGHLRAQQLPALGDGDELRRRRGRTALQPLLDAFQRVRHELTVEHGVDAAAQADELGAAGQRRGVRQRLELQPRAVVVEQHATVEVAHDHALRELAHQRGEAGTLPLDAAAGQCHLLRHVLPQAVALLRQFVEGARQALQRRSGAGGRQFTLHVGAEQHLRLFEQLRRCGEPEPVQRLRRGRSGRHQAQRDHHQQRHPIPQKLRHRRALLVGQRRPHQRAATQGKERQQGGGTGCRQRRRHDQALLLLHGRGGAASSSRTFRVSSCVEKGLVM